MKLMNIRDEDEMNQRLRFPLLIKADQVIQTNSPTGHARI